MISDKSLSIRSLESQDANTLAGFMSLQKPEYLRFFYAFGTDESAIAEMLAAAGKDVYSGVFWQANLIGVFMLRGWDAGFELPSLGVLVDAKYRGNRILELMIDSAKMICRLSGVKKIFAKSHPDNAGLKNLIRMGFCQVGIEESTGNTIWHLDC